MRLTLSVRNKDAVVRNLFASQKDIVDAMQEATIEHGELLYDMVQNLCPIDTGFMVNNLRLSFSPGFQIFEVGWLEEDFYAAGKQFYPVWVEFGTSKMAAQPSLYPARDAVLPLYKESMSRLVKEAVSRRRR